MVHRSVYSPTLEATLRESGFFDIGMNDRHSRLSSAAVVAEIAKLPVCLEVAASLLIKPIVCENESGPIALVFGDPSLPCRFMPHAKTALILSDQGVRLLTIQPGDVTPVESLFAYPIGFLSSSAINRAKTLAATSQERLSTWWRVGLALEIYGALSAALDLTVQHVTLRRAFGKPIGAMQSIQHRLAMSATTVAAIRWLALRAADTQLAKDAALAAGYAQQSIFQIVYDVHQFSGATGLTLEYPLHLFTYRARMLQSELFGAGAQIEASVGEIWPDIT